MNPEVLEKVLSCPKLPSLPAVAMRVVELTRDQKVSMRDLAETIQNDQALTAKILKTVNSSLFGLRQKCSSINQAIIMLGMSAVKSLALGFSLVSAIKDSAQDFDLNEHWRRSLFTAVAAKTIAQKAGIGNQEECFLGGLLQDVGMIALMQTLGSEYTSAIAASNGNHRKVVKLELEKFEISHPDLGALLANRWKLPSSLIMPIKYHERPSAAPSEEIGICRAVGLGNVAADLLTTSEPAQHLRRFYEKAEHWFGLNASMADDVLKAITAATREAASLLSVATGQLPDSAAILASAKREMANMIIPELESPESLDPIYSMNSGSLMIDEITGVATRERFEQVLIAAFEQAKAGVTQASVVLLDLDNANRLAENIGEDGLDAALMGISRRLTKIFANMNGLVARLSSTCFGIIVTRHDRNEVARAAELARTAVAAEPIRLIAAKAGAPAQVSITVSAGVVTIDKQTIDLLDDAQAMLTIAEAALSTAQRAGQNAVRIYQPKAA